MTLLTLTGVGVAVGFGASVGFAGTGVAVGFGASVGFTGTGVAVGLAGVCVVGFGLTDAVAGHKIL